jgi:TonB family protein
VRPATAILILLLCGAAFAQDHKVGVNRYVAPKYPPIALRARIQGDVVLDLKLNGDGEVVAIDVVNAHPMLKAAAVDALKAWRFICIDCRWNESFNLRFTVAFRIADGDCNLRITRSLIDFPKKITVEQGSGCVETTVSSSKADLH